MRTDPALRTRYRGTEFPPGRPVVSGGLMDIIRGVFGKARPLKEEFQEQATYGHNYLYTYHQGDLFLPGAQNLVFDPLWETPLATMWGNGFLVQSPNAFAPFSAEGFILINNPMVRTFGAGGPQHGQMILQPLQVIESESVGA